MHVYIYIHIWSVINRSVSPIICYSLIPSYNLYEAYYDFHKEGQVISFLSLSLIMYTQGLNDNVLYSSLPYLYILIPVFLVSISW